eukprot:3408945-Prorocentrum_lima.AAC.1
MKCYGICAFLGLLMDVSGRNSEGHLRIDANDLAIVTTHLPEQKETIQMVSQLRHEVCSGVLHDL